MKLLTENTVDAVKEKHVPVIEKISGGVKVMGGEVAHPMQKNNILSGLKLLPMERLIANF